jgi:amino acid adenylation domain-containing protein
MLSERERALLTERLRRGRVARNDAGQIVRRDPDVVTPPASFGQEQLWFLDRLAPGQAIYNVPCVIRARGPLAAPALARAVERLAHRHEALRTRLVPDARSRPVQAIDPPRPVTLGLEDLTGFEPAKRDTRLREYIQAEAMRPFDLAAGPLFRASLARLAPAEHVLVAVVHHAVFDGWSAGVLWRDLAALYAAEVTGEPSGLAELPVQFADYALWERQRLGGPVLADLQAYWRDRLTGFETVQFPVDRPRPAVDDFTGGLAELMAGPELLAGLREVSRREGTTLFVTVLAGLLTLLQRYTGQDDLVVGTVSANRGRAELAPLIGFLVNTLPIRCDLSGDPAFTDVLAQVKEAMVGAFGHQDLPFAQLVDSLKVERDASRTPVFQICFTYAERDDMPVRAAGVDFLLSDVVRGLPAAQFDLAFATEARRDGLWVECSYKTALFDAGTIERLLENLEVLLRGVVAGPSAPVSRLPLLTQAQFQAELRDWNDTSAPVPGGCVHERFEAQAASTPDAIAAEYEGQQITYRQLNRQANQVARLLRARGAGPEALIGICMRTGLRRLAALLGAWKAGGGYVPLDPALPAERLSFMIADTVMTVILTDDTSASSVAGAVNVDAEWDRLSRLPGDDLAGTGVTPGCVAYVMYTSGSTGQPKGVVLEHRHVVSALHGMIGRFGIGPGDTVLQFASFAFDASVQDTFMPLLGGARVVLAAAETLQSPSRLAALMRQARVTVACLPPAVLDLLPAGHYPDLRILMPGGEELPAELARRWIRPGLRLINSYGPTEATIDATYAELDPSTQMPPPIGHPAGNYRAYVLDRHLNPVPAGVTGELHIGGASVARGYLNRPDLTQDRFIPDPFTPGERLYKTGDLVRRRPDGSIMFLGRIDSQVKIRGLRIELGEIESALAAHPAIAQAIAVVVAGPAGGKEIAAYLRPVHGTIGEQEIRAHLARTLPAWMIPAHLITVGTFPLSPNGKVDRKALPVPRRQAAEEPVAPHTPAEAALVSLYATVLGTGQVGATDSFFDLGGNSLTAMRLVDLIRHQTGADIGVTSVFLHPTPRRLAAALESSIGSAGNPLVELAGQDGPPLFLVHAIEGTVTAYIPLAQELAGTVEVLGLESPALSDPAAIAASLDDLVTDYTRRIRAVQPAGPYALGGWSMGGVIAFEVAQRLEQAGADIGLLVLLDAPFVIPAAQQEEASGTRWLDVFQAHHQMIAGYQPSAPPVRAPTVIVSAARSLNAATSGQWRRLLTGPVLVLPVETDHYAFLRPPLVADVGAAIRTWHDKHREAPADGR